MTSLPEVSAPAPYPRTWASASSSIPSTRTHDSSTFTVMTYNILADMFISPGTYLYCGEEDRYMATRYPRLLAEIRHHLPDIVCLQEVEPDLYTEALKKDMAGMGYSGLYAEQRQSWRDEVIGAMTPVDGLAIFYKDSVFALEKSERCVLHSVAESFVKESRMAEATQAKFLGDIQRPKVSLLVQLQHKQTGHCLHLANVHCIYEKQKYEALQTAQAICGLRKMIDFSGFSMAPMILCGDFNMPPYHPGYSLLSEGHVTWTEQHKFSENFSAKEISQIIPDLLNLPSNGFNSAYKIITGKEPDITISDNAPSDTNVCLDYLWFESSSLKVIDVLLTPPSEAINQFTALPNSLFPSDHIYLMAQFKFSFPL